MSGAFVESRYWAAHLTHRRVGDTNRTWCLSQASQPRYVDEPSTGYDWCDTCLLRGPDDPTVVYRYLDADEVPVYIGCTINPLQRLLEHQQYARWWGDVRSYRSEHFIDRDVALDREAELIRLYRPRGNANPFGRAAVVS